MAALSLETRAERFVVLADEGDKPIVQACTAIVHCIATIASAAAAATRRRIPKKRHLIMAINVRRHRSHRKPFPRPVAGVCQTVVTRRSTL
jgi:hypothetical protein